MARKPADQTVDREDILSAAAEIFRHKGYEATTMKDIAAKVNLTAASLYHHFRNKDFLLLNVLEGGLDIGIAELENIAASDLSNTEKLGQMIRYHVVSVAENVEFAAAMIFEVRPLLNASGGNRYGGAKLMEEFRARRSRFIARQDYFEGLFRNVLLGGICAGEFRQVDAPTVTRAMLGGHNWVSVWYSDGGRLSAEDVADVMVDTWLAALRVSD